MNYLKYDEQNASKLQFNILGKYAKYESTLMEDQRIKLLDKSMKNVPHRSMC